MKDFVVVGGGTAGWLTALFVNKNIPYSNVTVIASSEIGILGAGEGTTGNFYDFITQDLDINIDELIKNCKATIKNAIKFTNWNGVQDTYFHPISTTGNDLNVSVTASLNNKVLYDVNGKRVGQDAMHFDANLLAKYLQIVGLSRGIKLIDDEVVDIVADDSMYIEKFNLKSGANVNADFVFDCTGFKRLIIGDFYKTQWRSYSNSLPVNRAMPFFLPNENQCLPPYTEAIAMKYGWMWKIPVQGRYGCGYVFDSNLVSDEEIKMEVEEYLGHTISSTRMFSFNAGCFEKTWVNNCIAIGLSSGFIEPLEATSIGTSIQSLKMFKTKIMGMTKAKHQPSINEYNQSVRQLNEEILNFLYIHYLTDRKDSNFWKDFRNNNIAPDLAEQVLLLGENLNSKKLNHLIKNMPTNQVDDYITLFNIKSWEVVLSGIGLGKIYQQHIVDVSELVDHNDYIRSKYES